jgi:hypothetical protein
MLNLSELVRGGTFCLSKAGLAIAGTTSKVKTAAPNGAGVDFAIGGKLYHLVDTDNFWTLSGADITALHSCIFVLGVDKDGTMHIAKGTEQLTTDVTAGTPLEFPVIDSDVCALGYIRIDAGASLFDPGTTALTGGTVTVTYVDCFAIPDAPIVS